MDFSVSEALSLAYGKIESWLSGLATMLPNIVVALITVVFFYFLAKGVRKLTRNILQRVVQQKSFVSLFTGVVYLFVIGIGLVIALNLLQLDKTITSLLAGAGIAGLALGFAFQDIASNFISGVLIALRKPIRVGDIIETNSYMGKVEKIDLGVTVVRTFQGLHVIIPNKDVLQLPVTNYTKTNERRVDLELGISYADDLDKVKELTLKTISALSFLLPDKEVKFFYKEFGDSSINFVVMFWIEYPDEPGYLGARSEAIMAIKRAFDDNNVTIPFPIRTLDFGIKGGEKLSEMKLMGSNAHS